MQGQNRKNVRVRRDKNLENVRVRRDKISKMSVSVGTKISKMSVPYEGHEIYILRIYIFKFVSLTHSQGEGKRGVKVRPLLPSPY